MDKIKNTGHKVVRKKFVVVFLVVIVLIFSALTLYSLLHKENEIPEEKDNSTGVVSYSTNLPDEEPPTECSAKDDKPNIIKIAAIDVQGCMQEVGVDQYERIAVPTNVHMAGWYVNSVKPGDEGLSIVTGHRDGIRTIGIFHELGRLEQGDRIEIEYGNGIIKLFDVVEIKQVSTEEASDILYEQYPDITNQLTLITCGGKWNEEEKTYFDRIIVVCRGV